MFRFFILNLIILFLGSSCIPKTEQLVEDNTSTSIDKKNNRSIANEKNVRNFNSLDVQMNVRIGDREYIQNVFLDVFGPTADPIVRPFILNNGNALNGSCSQYEATYANNLAPNATALIIDDTKADCNFSSLNSPVIGNENSIREGLRIQACEKVVSDTNSLFYLIDNVTGIANAPATFSVNPTEDHIKKMYNRFYPGRNIHPDVLNSLKAVGDSSILTTSKDRFKLIALTICMSADWQIP